MRIQTKTARMRMQLIPPTNINITWRVQTLYCTDEYDPAGLGYQPAYANHVDSFTRSHKPFVDDGRFRLRCERTWVDEFHCGIVIYRYTRRLRSNVYSLCRDHARLINRFKHLSAPGNLTLWVRFLSPSRTTTGVWVKVRRSVGR